MLETATLPTGTATDDALPRYARACIRAALGGPPAVRPRGPAMDRRAAAFVTLRHPTGELQGCIGAIEARGPLVEAVPDCAMGAAFRDMRGRPLELADADDLFIEVSVLSPLERIHFTDEESARAALRVGQDGVVLRYRHHQGTFLPQMWPRLGNDPETFLNELKRKAGLPRSFWSPEIELHRYTVHAHEDGIEPPEED
jgi:hypothetical protein